MSHDQPPTLREPDLPRTAKVRPVALRTGWTTGACATAATKAALTALVGGQPQDRVEITLPSGRPVGFAVERCTLDRDADGTPFRAEAVVIKDAGDDPDVTHGAHLTATVTWRPEPGVQLDAGPGVGTVTKPGLGLPVGGPAINDTPRRMISSAVHELIDTRVAGVRVVIAVPGGEAMARKTTNARLGILGGISILGTTGIVRPFSTASWRASVVQAVHVLAAQGERTVVLCTGGRTERAAMALLPQLPPVCFVEVGDFTGAAVGAAVEDGVAEVAFVGMAGKLAKLAAGILMTHYTRSKVDLSLLAAVTADAGAPPDVVAAVAAANTGRHAYELWDSCGLLAEAGGLLCRRVQEVLVRYADGAVRADVAMVDFAGDRVVASSGRWAA
ncbi:MAG TPA: cobalt-precorrin-5B (C(1))-methyltransferase [Kineosporiaceae bacterium]|jgi:cobalt-precorrin-5B (C1)-methyltransferase|nr:cobalt-precorrin-5B (C(1))-methyltransferase [Kineosporiaceae bacterium]